MRILLVIMALLILLAVSGICYARTPGIHYPEKIVTVTDNTISQQYTKELSYYLNLNIQLQLKLNETEQMRVDYENKRNQYAGLENSINLKISNLQTELDTARNDLEVYKLFNAQQDFYISEVEIKLETARTILRDIYTRSDNITAADMTASDKDKFYISFGKWYLSDKVPDWLR